MLSELFVEEDCYVMRQKLLQGRLTDRPRVCTDFWIQIQDFFQTFFQKNNLFFQTQGYQIGDQ